MLNILKWFLIGVSFLILSACGGGSPNNISGDSAGNNGGKENTSNPTYATAMLGNLAEANVTIYKIEDNGSFTKLWDEKTSSGNSLDEIGKFDMHLSELDDDTFYLYKVVGGKDWDSDDDGVKDSNFTINKGTIRAIAKGSDLKVSQENFKITYTSELIYEKIAKTLKYNFNKATFTTKLNDAVKKVIESDINSDGTIDIQDMLQFDPKNDSNNLVNFYKKQKSVIINTIHQGNIPSLNIPSKIGSFDTNNSIKNVILSNDGNIAYIIDTNGLKILNINDKSKPKLISNFNIDDNATNITISNDMKTAYISNENNQLMIVDVSNNSNPLLLNSYDINTSIQNITISNDNEIAYIACGNNLKILDISNKSNPKLLSFFDTGDKVNNIILSSSGETAYVANGDNGLSIFDVSDSTNPTLLKSYYTDSDVKNISISNDGKIAYISSDIGLEIYDITDNNPNIIGFSRIYNNKKFILSKNSKMAYIITNGWEGNIINIYDLSNKSNPKLLTRYYEKNSYYNNIVLSNDEEIAYLSSNNGLIVLDINSIQKSQYSSCNVNGMSVNKAIISEDESKIFATVNNNGTEHSDALAIFDISDKMNPKKLSSYERPLYIVSRKPLIDNTTAYISVHNHFLTIDTSDSNSTTLLNDYDISESIYDMALSKDKKIVYTIGSNNFKILDVNDSSNPILLGTYDIEDSSYQHIALSHNNEKAYITNNNKLIILDISNSNNPILLGSYDGVNGNIVVSNDDKTVYIADMYKGLVILDVSDSSNPSLKNIYSINGINDVVLSNDNKKAYIVNNNGLSILSISHSNNLKILASYEIPFASYITLSKDNKTAYVSYGSSISIINLSLYE